MNEKWNAIYNDEKNISLMDMLFYILKKWKSILLAAVVTMVLVAIVTVAGSYVGSQNEEHDNEANFTAEEMEVFQVQLDMIEEYKDNIREYDDYLTNSIKLKLDASKYYDGEVKYLLSAEDTASLLNVANAYKTRLSSEACLQELSSNMENNPKPEYLWEIVSVKQESYTDVSFTNNGKQALLTVTTKHYDKEECEKMLQFFEQKVQGLQREMDGGTGVTVSKIVSDIHVYSDMNLVPLRNAVNSEKSKVYGYIEDIEDNMTAEQWDYYKSLANGQNITENDNSISMSGISYKYAVIAAVAMAVVMFWGYAALYLLGGRVHSKQELESYIPVPIMSFDAETDRKKKNVVDAFISKLEKRRSSSVEENLEMIAAMIKNYASQYDTQKVYITGSRMLFAMNDQTQCLKELLQKENIELIAGNSILKDPMSLKEAGNCGYIVFWEKCSKTLEKDVLEEANKAISCGMKILGVILEK